MISGKAEGTLTGLGMPDFVFSTAKSEFSNRFREKILSFDCMSLRSA